jgi:hypothetical protein
VVYNVNTALVCVCMCLCEFIQNLSPTSAIYWTRTYMYFEERSLLFSACKMLDFANHAIFVNPFHTEVVYFHCIEQINA